MESKTISFDFYYGKEAEQFSFYRIPKTLFTNPAFSKLSSDAKILYGLMLDRLGLSIKNGWKDNEDRVFIFFTLAEVQVALKAIILLNGKNLHEHHGFQTIMFLNLLKQLGLVYNYFLH